MAYFAYTIPYTHRDLQLELEALPWGDPWLGPMLQREARRVVCRGPAQRGELLDGVLLQHARRRVEGDLARQRLRALRRHRRPPPVDAARAAGLGGIGLGFGLGLGLGFG